MRVSIIICFQEGHDSGMFATEIGKQDATGNNSQEHFQYVSFSNVVRKS